LSREEHGNGLTAVSFPLIKFVSGLYSNSAAINVLEISGPIFYSDSEK